MRTVASEWSEDKLKMDNQHFYLAVSHLVLTCVMLLFNCFADKITDKQFLASRKPCPNYSASFLSAV